MNDINEIKNKLLVYYSKEELVDIILKAIKHIEENTENIDRDTYYEDYVETYDLLKILKGGENE